jgi:hypothetical protein
MLLGGGMDEMIVETEESSFSGVEFGVCRLEAVEE